MGMLDGIVHSFLSDAIEFLFDFEGEVRFLTEIRLYSDAVASVQGCSLFGECSDESLGL